MLETILIILALIPLTLIWAVWIILITIELVMMTTKSYELGKTFGWQEYLILTIIFILGFIPILNYFVFKKLAETVDTLEEALTDKFYKETQDFFDPSNM